MLTGITSRKFPTPEKIAGQNSQKSDGWKWVSHEQIANAKDNELSICFHQDN